jgi:Multicopper oxidase
MTFRQSKGELGGYIGRYDWHCRILEHEDNEMMGPYEVVTKQAEVEEAK